MLNDSNVLIIAEAGLNHNGDLSLAKTLVDRAYEVRADAIKFQTFKAETLVAQSTDSKQYDLLKSLELSFDDHQVLFDYCKTKGIPFLSSPFDPTTADFLDSMGVTAFKIASSELTNHPLLDHIGRKDKPILLSTGMSDLVEVGEAIHTIQKVNDQPLTLLHCVSSYPTAPEDVNLQAIETMEIAFHLAVGYSDHTLGIEIPVAAVALGATVIEKHFTLDSTMKGPDHSISLDPQGFKEMVTAIRNVEKALGDGLKVPVEKELPVREAARRSLVAQRPIPAGTPITAEMITSKRPGHGIPPKYFDLIIGKRLPKALEKDETITWDILFP
ncbi:MAG TPA: N-acetylneuraminate synthase [Spirochaetes bacterium]|nr:N-acetylneuraminate synthase [Spirochaetota bacterium]